MAKIDTLVREHYESKRLDDHALERLAQLADKPDQPEHGARSFPGSAFLARTGFQTGLAIAATVIIALLFTLSPNGEYPGLQERVAQEIALNHNKNLSVEYASADLHQISARMTELDFELSPPDQLASRELVLIGARYCSIQGQIAAQLKYQDKNSGQRYTLYQTRLNTELKPLQEGKLEHEQVTIELWQDDNLLMGLARDAASQ